MHASTVGRALRGVAHPVAVSPVDPAEAVADVLDLGIARDTPAEDTPAVDTPAEDVVVSAGDSVVAWGRRRHRHRAGRRRGHRGRRGRRGRGRGGPGIDQAGGGGARIGEGSFTSRYAGVMLLHPFLDRVARPRSVAGVWSCLAPL